jgi:hypothetical protein
MMMDVCVKLPQDAILDAAKKLQELPCLRKQVTFQLVDGSWSAAYSCNGYGNGYGVGFRCKEDCSLRITDLSLCRKVETPDLEGFPYLVQEGFYKGR